MVDKRSDQNNGGISACKLILFRVVDEGYKVFVVRSNKYWSFPGGKPLPNETPKQCLAREVSEETDFTCINDVYEHVDDQKVRIFTYPYPVGYPEINHLGEIIESKWVLTSEIEKLTKGFWKQGVVDSYIEDDIWSYEMAEDEEYDYDDDDDDYSQYDERCEVCNSSELYKSGLCQDCYEEQKAGQSNVCVCGSELKMALPSCKVQVAGEYDCTVEKGYISNRTLEEAMDKISPYDMEEIDQGSNPVSETVKICPKCNKHYHLGDWDVSW